MSIVEAIGAIQFAMALGLLIGMTGLGILAIKSRSRPGRARKLIFLTLVLSILTYVLGTFFYHGGLSGYHRMLSGAGRDPEHFDLSHAAFHASQMTFSIVSAFGLIITSAAALFLKSPEVEI